MINFFIKHKLNILVGFAIAFLSITLLIYAYKFGTFSLSNETTVWGTFGDFIGGVLSPIFSFISILLIIYSIKEQRDIYDRQKFESTFFKLIELQKDAVQNLEIQIDELYEDEFDQRRVSKILKANDALNELATKEWHKIEAYFTIQAIKSNDPKHLSVYNYRFLNHHFIQTRDYLTSIVRNIIYIFKLINDAKITAGEKEFYHRLLKDNLTDAQKFFVVVFFKQMNNSICDEIIEKDLIKLCGPKDWILRAKVLNDEFPFCIPGICLGNSCSIDDPVTYYQVPLKDFRENDFFYLVKLINSNIICERINISFDDGALFAPAKSDMVLKNNTYHFNLKSFFKKYFSNNMDLNTIQDITFLNNGRQFCDSNLVFTLKITVQLNLNSIRYDLKDEIVFQYQTNGSTFLNIRSQNNIAWKRNWRIHSFANYH